MQSLGRVDEVVREVLKNQAPLAEVFEGMLHDNPRVIMRTADALEKVSSKHPEYLQPFKTRLMEETSGRNSRKSVGTLRK